jgi:phosphoribosylformimino-5-aminoimidazole carboxamide ribotide isomerase
MKIYPAIDLMGGRVVRLSKGDYANPTFYETDPVKAAQSFENAGARWLHLIDLDAAKTGEKANLEIVRRIRSETDLHIQCGGGIRSLENARDRLEAGADRVILGTVAIENESLAAEIIDGFPGEVVISLDARGRNVATNGWNRPTGLDLVECARRFDGTAVAALIVTDIEHDGMLQGPSFVQLRDVLSAVDVPIIASGGIGTLSHLAELSAFEAGGRRLSGCVTGKALYEGRFTLQEAIDIAR